MGKKLAVSRGELVVIQAVPGLEASATWRKAFRPLPNISKSGDLEAQAT